jgi:hypothetical protein
VLWWVKGKPLLALLILGKRDTGRSQLRRLNGGLDHANLASASTRLLRDRWIYRLGISSGDEGVKRSE